MLALDRTGLIIPTLCAVLIHETAHLLAMWAADCAPIEIRLIPASVQITEKYGVPSKNQAGIIICGPLGNIAAATAAFINFRLTGQEPTLNFALLNGVLAAFNLLPVAGLDGGRLLELFLSRKSNPNVAAKTVSMVTYALSGVMFLAGVYLTICGNVNLSVFIVALYLAVCALIKK